MNEEKLETKIDLKDILKMGMFDLEHEIKNASERYTHTQRRITKMHRLLEDLKMYQKDTDCDDVFRILSNDQEQKILSQIEENIKLAKEEWFTLSLLLAIYDEATKLEGKYNQIKHSIYCIDRTNNIKY